MKGLRKGIVDVIILATCTICPQTTMRHIEWRRSLWTGRLRMYAIWAVEAKTTLWNLVSAQAHWWESVKRAEWDLHQAGPEAYKECKASFPCDLQR
jgi:hypothetical protein